MNLIEVVNVHDRIETERIEICESKEEDKTNSRYRSYSPPKT